MFTWLARNVSSPTNQVVCTCFVITTHTKEAPVVFTPETVVFTDHQSPINLVLEEEGEAKHWACLQAQQLQQTGEKLK